MAAPKVRRRRVPQWVLPAVTVAVVLVVVDLAREAGLGGGSFPTVVAVGKALGDELTTSQFWWQVGQTMHSWLVGLAIAIVAGIPLGLIVAANRFIFRSTRLVVDFLRPIPPVAVLPLAVLILGTGTQMTVYLVAFSAFWPVLFQVIYGAQDVDPVARDTARSFGLSRMQQYRHVVLPSASPYIATGIRLATTVALVVTVATELIVGSSGLGFQINQFENANRLPAMYALIFVTGVLGWLNTVGFRLLERRALRWHQSYRKEVAQ